MGDQALNRRFAVSAAVAALCLVLLISLVLMGIATQNVDRFSRLYSSLLLINTVGLVTLVTLIGANIRRLLTQLREKRPGSRLTLRMLTLFVVLAVPPVLIVYGFSLDFLRRGIDSWFNVEIEQAVNDSLELSRTALDIRMRDLLRHTLQLAEEVSESSESITPLNLDALRGPGSTMVLNTTTITPVDLDELRLRSDAEELTLLTDKGRIIATSSTATDILPNPPGQTILLQLGQARSYIGLDPIRDAGLYVRVVVNVPDMEVASEARILQALYPISTRMNSLADSVQSAYVKYTELAYLRDQLKISFTMTLTLVLLFTISSATWAAFYSARRMAAPIRDLAEGTRAIAHGDYGKRLPVPSHDEMGFLVESFNEMTSKIAIAQAETRRSRDEADAERAYLEAVLSRLSSGVLTLDGDLSLRTVNPSAIEILGISLEPLLGCSLDALLSSDHAVLRTFFKTITPHLTDSSDDWQEQVLLFGASGRQVLMCRGTGFAGTSSDHSGHVIVFDDITALIQGQRDAAWSEVARRLAHEIKNPLTPIQLSAERLRHKYLRATPPTSTDALDRLTNTIIQQVETMKEMVNTFSEYARPPQVQPESVDLNPIVEEVLDLYRGVGREAHIVARLQPGLPAVKADQKRLRQVLNNVVKNGLEAMDNEHSAQLTVVTSSTLASGQSFVELRVSDQGPGISQDILSNVFEPYVTTKPRGTGLGLAIVKKIVEEHGGVVWIANNPDEGASVFIRLPVSVHEGGQDEAQEPQRNAI